MTLHSSSLKLPRLISDGMVLQRSKPVKIWGWAKAGECISIRFLGEEYRAITDSGGTWVVTLPELDAGGPYSMEIAGNDQQIVIDNILVGDVWLCSGQSNMVLPMERVDLLYSEEIASSTNPAIRQFKVPDRYDFNTSHRDLESGQWQEANPENVLGYTAAGYFFAKALYEQYGVPIGLIASSVGGSPVESWLSEDALRRFPEYLAVAKECSDRDYVKQVQERDEKTQAEWYHTLHRLDKGLTGQTPWYDPAYTGFEEWSTMNIPANWDEEEKLADLVGVVWFRKEITIPKSLAGKPARLLLGAIVDSDTTYLNGEVVGTTAYQYPPRKYIVPAGLLKEGKNVLVVRVVSNTGHGAFVRDKPYQLTIDDTVIDLTGQWQYQIGAVTDPLPPVTFFQNKPLGLFNGMIAPLVNYALKGVIWYQGESNTEHPSNYFQLFSALIEDWRDKWKQSDLPFLYVQLANFMPADKTPSESNWAELREQQLKALAVPHTAMAVAIDIGEWNDLHPLNKKDVGERLALGARYVAYGEHDLVYSGPIYQSMKKEENKIVLTFDHVDGGLVAKGNDKLNHFAIAGPDGKFIWAEAKIEGDRVVVWHDDIEDPAAVRYGWANNPEGANLYNKAGLPASPFRTDQD